MTVVNDQDSTHSSSASISTGQNINADTTHSGLDSTRGPAPPGYPQKPNLDSTSESIYPHSSPQPKFPPYGPLPPPSPISNMSSSSEPQNFNSHPPGVSYGSNLAMSNDGSSNGSLVNSHGANGGTMGYTSPGQMPQYQPGGQAGIPNNSGGFMGQGQGQMQGGMGPMGERMGQSSGSIDSMGQAQVMSHGQMGMGQGQGQMAMGSMGLDHMNMGQRGMGQMGSTQMGMGQGQMGMGQGQMGMGQGQLGMGQGQMGMGQGQMGMGQGQMGMGQGQMGMGQRQMGMGQGQMGMGQGQMGMGQGQMGMGQGQMGMGQGQMGMGQGQMGMGQGQMGMGQRQMGMGQGQMGMGQRQMGMGQGQMGMNGMGMSQAYSMPGQNNFSGRVMSNGGMNNMSGNGMYNNMTSGMQNSVNPQGGVTYPGFMGSGESNSNQQGSLDLPAVGGFSEMSGQLPPLPQATLSTAAEAGERLVALKTRVNELATKRDGFKKRQMANGGVAAASVLFTAGFSLLVQGPAAVHLNNLFNKAKAAISECLGQINIVRDRFGSDPSWFQAEQVTHIQESVFTGGQSRSELRGPL